MKSLKNHITESFINESKVAQSFDQDTESVLKELKAGKIKAEIIDDSKGLIAIPKNQDKKANEILKKINAFDDKYNFIQGVESVDESLINEGKELSVLDAIKLFKQKHKNQNAETLAEFCYDNYSKLTGLPKKARDEENDFPELFYDLVEKLLYDMDDFQDAWTDYAN